MKKNQGITLISLIITIIVMIILASTAIYSGVTTINSAKLTAFETELRIMQSEVNDLYDKYKNGETILIDSVETNILDLGQPAIGTEADVNVEAKATIALDGAEVVGDDTIRSNYRYFTQEYLEKLGVEGINQDFLLNIKSRKVLSYQGFKYEGVRYYTLEQISNDVYNVEYIENENIPTFESSVTQLENGNWKVSINNIQYEGNIEKWRVKYQIDEEWDYWAESDSLEFIVKEEGIYNIYINNGKISSNEEKIEIKEKGDTSGANHPDLKTGMTAITYNSDGSVNTVADSTKRDWYSYEVTTDDDMTDGGTTEGGNSRWANAKLNGNYYVWIPRYAYKIDKSVSYTSQEGKSYKIDVKFIGKDVTQENIATKLGSTYEDYIVHPAFTFGTVGETTIPNELSGIWVGKYETSGTESSPTILPNQVAATKETISDLKVAKMFEMSKNVLTSDTQKAELDAHMMKNTEWGAVAYLSQSQYGRNGTEISINQSSQKKTGAGKTEGTNLIYEGSSYSTDPTAEQQYNGKIGKLSSTTGNIYGVYDMSGGVLEYVMGFYGTAENTPTLGNTGFTAETIPEGRYYDLYINKTSADSTNIGDALYETKGWNGDNATFVYSRSPIFRRGGSYAYANRLRWNFLLC